MFLILLRAFSWVYFYRAFLSGSVLSSTPYIGLLCLLRMHVINSCVGDTWQRLWRDDFTHNGKQAVNRLKIPQGLSTLMFRRWSEVPSRGGVRGDSPSEKQTCFTKTWHFDCLFSRRRPKQIPKTRSFMNLLRSSSTQNLVVLFFKACYSLPFPSKHLFFRLFVRSLSTQLFFLVVVLPLLLSMTAFSYVGLLSLFLVRIFYALYLSHLPPSSFREGLSSEQFSELESVHLLAVSARACSLTCLSLGVSFLAMCMAVLIYLVLFSGLF